MVLQSLLYMCTHTFSWSEDGMTENWLDPDNLLGWDKMKLNLPGSAGYNPSKPWVYR